MIMPSMSIALGQRNLISNIIVLQNIKNEKNEKKNKNKKNKKKKELRKDRKKI